MTFEEMQVQFKPGRVARRITWDPEYSLEIREGSDIRLYCTRLPGFQPVWRKGGYDALADDYYFVK